MSLENVALVRRAYDEAFAERSVAGPLRRFIADDFSFHMRAEFPGRAVYGIEEITEMWADMDATFSDFQLVPNDFAEFGDYVLVTINQSTRVRGSDLRVEATIYHLWHVTGGKAQEAWAYSDRDEALEAAGLSE
jgi:ketosteroid isomerase-like protein